MIIFHGGGNRTKAGRQDLNIEKKEEEMCVYMSESPDMLRSVQFKDNSPHW